jgi:hypothetical protein
MSVDEGVMKRPVKRIFVVITGALVLVGGITVALVIGGFLGAGETVAYPPCNELPSVASADSALASHANFAAALTAVGPEVEVSVGTPCKDNADAALIQVTYKTKDQREAIGAIINTRDGFGVPVYLVKQ